MFSGGGRFAADRHTIGPADYRMGRPPAVQARHPLAQEGQGTYGARKECDSAATVGPVQKVGLQYGTGNEISNMKGRPRNTFMLEREDGVSNGTDLQAEAGRRAQTLKYSKRLKEQMQEQLERKTREAAERRRGPSDVFNPFGHGQPLRDDSGNLVRRKATLEKGMASDIVAEGAEQDGLAFQLGCHGGGGGAPHRDRHGNIMGVRQHQQQQAPSQLEGEGYNPWGKPGCGAPKRNKNGQIEAARSGALSRETDSARTVLRRSQEKQRYPQQLRDGMQHYDTEVSRKTSGGIEVASWIRSGQVGQPPVDPTSGEFRGANRAISDVVQAKLALRRPAGEDRERYYQDLQQQAEERHRSRVREKEEDRRLAQQHIMVTEKMWNVERGVERNARHPLQMDRKLAEERATYRDELHQQASSKRVEAQMERQQALRKEEEHVDVFNSQWGRPGGGAPRQGAQCRQTNLMPPFAVTRRRS